MGIDLSFLKDRKVWMLLVVLMAYNFATSVVSPIRSLYVKSFGITIFSIGVIVGATSFSKLMVNIPFGELSDKLGRKMLIVLSLIFTAILTYAYLHVSSFGGFLLIGLFQGIANAMYRVSTWSYLTDSLKEGGKGYSLFSLLWTIPSIFGLYIGGYVGSIDYRINFYLSVFVLILSGIFSFFMVESLSAKKDGLKDSLRKTFKELFVKRNIHFKRNVLIISFISMCMCFDSSIFYTFLPVYLKDGFKVDEILIGTILSATSVVFLIVRFLEFLFYKKIPKKKTIFIGLAVIGFLYILIPFIKTFELFVAIILASCAAAYFAYPLLFSILKKSIPWRERGELLGIQQTFNDVGFIGGNFIGGAIAQVIGIPFLFVACGALYLISSAISIKMRKPREKI